MAKWIYKDNLIFCSECNVVSERITPYCAWCGKEMLNFPRPPVCDAYRDGRCWGTRERDQCSCEGRMTKCNFYDYMRQRGIAAEGERNEFKY